MWYFVWALGVLFSCSIGIIIAMWYEGIAAKEQKNG